MVENIFGTRMRGSESDDLELPEILIPTLETEDPDDDGTSKLLVIPISQEIAPDFQLWGYDATIRRIEEVLSQRGKQRNVLLYGDNGVGKTAIIHGLVQRKNRNDLSTHMYKRMFYRLNCSRLLHMDDVGEINRQFDQVLEECGRYDVMAIENFYNLITYLKLKGANVVLIGFLEALARRKLQSIITANPRERTLILNEVPEIHEYFASEKIPEPNDDELLNILRGVHRSYEARYDITIPDTTLCTTRDLTQKYRTGMEGWAQPGRSLILLDRSIAQFSVKMNSKPPELAALEGEIANAENELESLTSNAECAVGNTGDATRQKQLEERLACIRPKVEQMREQWLETTAPIRALQVEKSGLDTKLHVQVTNRRRLRDLRTNNTALLTQGTDVSRVDADIAKTNDMIKAIRKLIHDKDDALAKINLSALRDHVLGPEHISETFSELSGIPTDLLNEDERERVLKMEEILGERVFGQNKALSVLANAVRRERAKLTEDETTPKGSFLFLGPSGVGKTETGKALAWFLTGSDKNLIRIDMSEFMESHSVSRLIGAPPGYAGYDEGGVLTNAVLAKPKSVVMLDEAEKAHVDVFKPLLSVTSDGRLTDGKGVTVDFKETMIILTSNAGSRHFLNEQITFEQAEELAMKDVKNWLPTEFLGRLDGIVCFHRLELPMLSRVAKRRVDQINRSIGKNQLRLDFPDPDIETFCIIYRNPDYGARPILTAMKSTLERDLAIKILERTNGAGMFHAHYVNDALAVDFEPAYVA